MKRRKVEEREKRESVCVICFAPFLLIVWNEKEKEKKRLRRQVKSQKFYCRTAIKKGQL